MNITSGVTLFALAFLAFAATGGLIASVLVPMVERITARWSPDAKHRAWLLLAVAPLLLAASATLAAFAPSMLALAWPAHDHCPVHPGHVHLCLAHPPAAVANPAVQLGFGLVLAFFVVRSGSFLLEISRARRWAAGLLARASADPALGAHVLPTEQSLCVMVGLVRPSIVLSQGLLASVAQDELEAILEHERAHADRHDTLWALVARVSTAFMLPSHRRVLLAELALAAEQSSDERAAGVVGDRVSMAEIILKVERLLQDTPVTFRAVALSFGGTGVVERVTALLDPPRERRRMRLVPLLLLAAVIVLFSEAATFHHWVETLVGVIAS